MHYKIDNIYIETEYAAKSVRQPNKNVLGFIQSLPSDTNVLDYGCGKLRYTIPLSLIVNNVVAIDSIEQLTRKQIIESQYTTIKEYAENQLKNVQVYDVKKMDWKKINMILSSAQMCYLLYLMIVIE